eukprot:tig00000342_g24241.t1
MDNATSAASDASEALALLRTATSAVLRVHPRELAEHCAEELRHLLERLQAHYARAEAEEQARRAEVLRERGLSIEGLDEGVLVEICKHVARMEGSPLALERLRLVSRALRSAIDNAGGVFALTTSLDAAECSPDYTPLLGARCLVRLAARCGALRELRGLEARDLPSILAALPRPGALRAVSVAADSLDSHYEAPSASAPEAERALLALAACPRLEELELSLSGVALGPGSPVLAALAAALAASAPALSSLRLAFADLSALAPALEPLAALRSLAIESSPRGFSDFVAAVSAPGSPLAARLERLCVGLRGFQGQPAQALESLLRLPALRSLALSDATANSFARWPLPDEGPPILPALRSLRVSGPASPDALGRPGAGTRAVLDWAGDAVEACRERLDFIEVARLGAPPPVPRLEAERERDAARYFALAVAHSQRSSLRCLALEQLPGLGPDDVAAIARGARRLRSLCVLACPLVSADAAAAAAAVAFSAAEAGAPLARLLIDGALYPTAPAPPATDPPRPHAPRPALPRIC